jgi:hypothetical protein
LAHYYCETDPNIDPLFVRLCDLSGVTTVSVSEEALDQWAADPISNPPVRHALVCTTPNVLKRVLDFVTKSRRLHRDVSVFPTYRQPATWMRLTQPNDSRLE